MWPFGRKDVSWEELKALMEKLGRAELFMKIQWEQKKSFVTEGIIYWPVNWKEFGEKTRELLEKAKKGEVVIEVAGIYGSDDGAKTKIRIEEDGKVKEFIYAVPWTDFAYVVALERQLAGDEKGAKRVLKEAYEDAKKLLKMWQIKHEVSTEDRHSRYESKFLEAKINFKEKWKEKAEKALEKLGEREWALKELKKLIKEKEIKEQKPPWDEGRPVEFRGLGRAGVAKIRF